MTKAEFRKSFFTVLSKSGIINFEFQDLSQSVFMSGFDINAFREISGHRNI